MEMSRKALTGLGLRHYESEDVPWRKDRFQRMGRTCSHGMDPHQHEKKPRSPFGEGGLGRVAVTLFGKGGRADQRSAVDVEIVGFLRAVHDHTQK